MWWLGLDQTLISSEIYLLKELDRTSLKALRITLLNLRINLHSHLTKSLDQRKISTKCSRVWERMQWITSLRGTMQRSSHMVRQVVVKPILCLEMRIIMIS